MKDTLIVNLYGGPGCGKSTGAAYLFSKLKMAGVDAEYVTEFAKDKVWEESAEVFKCQFYITGKQAFRISRCFGKVEVIVTDSPIMLGKIYADRIGRPALGNACVEEAKRYEGNSMSIVLNRVKPYNTNGRNQTEAEANGIDEVVRCMLKNYKIPFSVASGDLEGYDAIFGMVMSELAERRRKAADTPIRGVTKHGIYRHFKGKYYLVEDCATNSETGERMVVYRHLYGNGGLCVRPVSMFLSEVDHEKYPDAKQKYRFELVDEFTGTSRVIRAMEQKLALLAKNPAEVFVVTHRKDDGTIEYSSPMTGPGGECLCAVMDGSWFDAVWYESQDEAETKIADSVRDIYSVERIRISRENLERDVVITRNPERISFKCSCGCEFNSSAETCRKTSGQLHGEERLYFTTTFWAHCPVCGHECSDLRIK